MGRILSCLKPFGLAGILCALVTSSLGAQAFTPRLQEALTLPFNTHIKGVMDVRAVHRDRSHSWINGGQGKTRYGNSDRGTTGRIAHLAWLLDSRPTDAIKLFLHGNYDADPSTPSNSGRLDFIEAYARHTADIAERITLRSKVGFFFPPISLEHTEQAWNTYYTITPSAINSWVGEELRGIGAEQRWQYEGDDDIYGLTAGIFGFNDPAGSLLSFRGWALHDRQSGFDDQLPLPDYPAGRSGGPLVQQADVVGPYKELDDRPGFYLGSDWRKFDRFRVKLLWYHNEAHEAAFEARQYAWRTSFVHLSLELDLPYGMELLAQSIRGNTRMGTMSSGGFGVDADFRSGYVMLGKHIQAHRLALRYDRFSVRDGDAMDSIQPNDETGRAFTVAYGYQFDEFRRVMLEWLTVHANRQERALMGLNNQETHNLFQLSYRWWF